MELYDVYYFFLVNVWHFYLKTEYVWDPFKNRKKINVIIVCLKHESLMHTNFLLIQQS